MDRSLHQSHQITGESNTNTDTCWVSKWIQKPESENIFDIGGNCLCNNCEDTETQDKNNTIPNDK